MIKFKVQYDLNLTAAQQLHAYGIRKAIRIAVNRASAPVKAAEVAAAEGIARYGFTAKSIRIRVKVYPGDRFVSVVGTSRAFKRTKGKYKRGKRKGEKRLIIPANYAWLVERGTKHARAKPWLKSAAEASLPQYQANVIEGVRTEIEAQLARRAAT